MVLDTVWHRYLKRPYRLEKVVDIGNGPINVVLIHGLASSSKIWTPLVKLFESEKYRVRSYDLLGFGVSPKPGYAKYSTKEHAKAIMHSLSKESAKSEQFIFIGHSMGCIITTYIACKWPDKVRAAVLYKPPLLDFDEKRSLHKKFYKYLAGKPPTLSTYAKVSNKFSNKLGGFKTDEESWLPIEHSLNNTILAQETLSQLEIISKPVHIIYGRFDFFVSKVKAKKLAQINPRLKLDYVPEMHDVKPKSSRYLKKLIEEL